MSQPTAEDRMGKLAKGCGIAALMLIGGAIALAAFAFVMSIRKPIKAVPFEQRGSIVERHAMRPAAPVERLIVCLKILGVRFDGAWGSS